MTHMLMTVANGKVAVCLEVRHLEFTTAALTSIGRV